MDSSDTFTLLPLHLDPATKAISYQGTPTTALTTELTALNDLHRSLLTLDTPNGIPPPPVPVNPKRTAQINKLRESGNDALRKGKPADALGLYTLALKMAAQRPPWEPAGLVREELAQLYGNRAQAYMAGQGWAEGAVDAKCSVELKKVGNAKAWWRRGRCLVEMGRLEEAREWVGEGLEFEAGEQDLVGLLKEVEVLIEKRKTWSG
ncbi:hypothetical protein P152DRAFT_395225 [Eremomyces bilateralis CBS 781.70]|uniref:Tetratricopeptide repeat domain-containing protein n=1 Tax=Eremomyces bilateralis CBS 781.70 TaxID=1392243 RepID=A0A6G1G618_9PEZI|nr:uncharacterized protein P152DRAFT_395225 [Eremomyces bilateralis CBS 781.70]KAF1813517.1 hypothetical protein P152DRAFT_395225 [Eremomyces bilateralis CBS 781.70]